MTGPVIDTPATRLPHSGIHDVFDRVLRLQRRGVPVIPLHIAEPVPTPSRPVVDAMREALKTQVPYTNVDGCPGFRTLLASHLEKKHGLAVDEEQILVCPGSTTGMLALYRCLWKPGAQSLLPAVHWPIHLHQPLLAGYRPLFYELTGEWDIAFDRLAGLPIQPGDVLLLNSPANPTGAVYSAELLRRIVELAHEKECWILSDEAYEDFVYEGEHLSCSRFEADLPPARRRVFTTFTFSKSHGLGPHRLGYVVAPSVEAASTLAPILETSIMTPSTLVQYGGMAALQDDSPVMGIAKRLGSLRKKALEPLMNKGAIARLPSGGWYTLVDVTSSGLNGVQFAERLLEEDQVSVVPGACFAARPALDERAFVQNVATADVARNLIRIAFSGTDADTVEGVKRIAARLRT